MLYAIVFLLHSNSQSRSLRPNIFVCRLLYPDEEDIDELLNGTIALATQAVLSFEATQATSAPATPRGVHEAPAVEVLSPMEAEEEDVEVQPILKPFMGEGGEHSGEFIDALLLRLREIPCVSPVTAYPFIPKSLTRRYAKLATQCLEWWVKEARCSVQTR